MISAFAREVVGVLHFPPGWFEGRDWVFAEVIAEGTLRSGTAILVGGVFTDGTNVMGLSYPGGQLLVRVAPTTGWAIEEHYEGKPATDPAIRKMWKLAIDSLADGYREVGP